MSDYVTDPEILSQLNGTDDSGYVTDPEILRELNKPEQPGFGKRLQKEISSVASAPGTTGVTDVLNRGLVSTIAGAPVDITNAGVKFVHGATNLLMSPFGYENKWHPSEAPVGGSEWMGQQMQRAGMVSPERRPILETAASLLPVAPTVAKGVYNLGRAAVNLPRNIARGAFINEPGQTLLNIENNSIASPAAVERYKLGYLSAQDLQNPENRIPLTTMQKAGVRLSGGQVPAAGRLGEATGERLAQDYSKPLGLPIDIASTLLTGVPYNAAKRMGQAGVDAVMSKNLRLDPELLARMKADLAPNATPAPVAPTAAPTTPPVAPVAPTTPNYQVPAYQRTNATIPGINAPVAPITPPVGQLSPPTTPAQVQGANFIGNTEKKFGLTPEAPETITQKAQRVMGDKYRAPVNEQPITGPVAPAELPPPPATAAPVTTAEGPIAPEGMPAPVAETPKPLPTPAEAAIIAQKAKPVKAAPVTTAPVNTPVLKGTEMKKEYPDDYYSPETGKYMSPEERRWRNEMMANEINSTIESRQVGVEGKGKKAKPVMEDVKITSYDPASWENNIQPDISWTNMVKENSIGRERYPTFILKGTKDGVEYTLKLNKNSAHMGDLYADINGKPTLVKQWYADYSERAPKEWDKEQKKLGIDLQKISHPNPAHTDARGFKEE